MSTTTAQPGIGFIGLADQGLPMATAAEAGLPLAPCGPPTVAARRVNPYTKRPLVGAAGRPLDPLAVTLHSARWAAEEDVWVDQ